MEAYWIEHEHLFSGPEYVCSCCGYRDKYMLEICPGCGSIMTGRGKYRPDFVDECFFMDLLGGD